MTALSSRILSQFFAIPSTLTVTGRYLLSLYRVRGGQLGVGAEVVFNWIAKESTTFVKGVT